MTSSQQDVLTGLNIFEEYRDEDEWWQILAEPDEIIAEGPAPGSLTYEDAKVLDGCGWTWDPDDEFWRISV